MPVRIDFRTRSSDDVYLVVNEGLSIPLTVTASRTALEVQQVLRAAEEPDHVSRERWRVSLTAYEYRFLDTGRSQGQELLAFHWHPDVQSRGNIARRPHVHLGAALGVAPDRPRHIPTGFLQLEDIVQFAIEELGATPALRGWRAVLERSRQATADVLPLRSSTP
ncbi:MAG TPA: hypothetical protein VFA70_13215 [Dehalococcoidia bacterium]|nr:hypothetical protein [Dehalococcoidia bacterium]